MRTDTTYAHKKTTFVRKALIMALKVYHKKEKFNKLQKLFQNSIHHKLKFLELVISLVLFLVVLSEKKKKLK